ncbi:hypothetical protein [Taibaiella koreensis]|uniref:hypothetical protein n=1 Tax=Taibaiella koreensis TaxID=1268548 RepID=UPI0013C32852|nr:hypothetical protein [Taibaiella koreensis]
MELMVSIFLPKNLEIGHLNLAPEIYEFDGQSYPQGLPKLEIAENWIIVETPIADYLLKLLPSKGYRMDWKCLSIVGKGLDEYVTALINSEEPDSSILEHIFDNTIFLADNWVLFFEINNSPFDIATNDNEGNLISKIKKRLMEGESFMIYKY